MTLKAKFREFKYYEIHKFAKFAKISSHEIFQIPGRENKISRKLVLVKICDFKVATSSLYVYLYLVSCHQGRKQQAKQEKKRS